MNEHQNQYAPTACLCIFVKKRTHLFDDQPIKFVSRALLCAKIQILQTNMRDEGRNQILI